MHLLVICDVIYSGQEKSIETPFSQSAEGKQTPSTPVSHNLHSIFSCVHKLQEAQK